MNLPTRSYRFYVGIDPGFKGAIALLNAAATTVHVWPMPVCGSKKDRDREIDLEGLTNIFRHLRRMPDCAVGLEWPSTRPGEGAERSERFGRGKGYLEAFAYLHHLTYFKLAPHGWKGRMGLVGKELDPHSLRGAGLWERRYPQWTNLIRGKRNGVLDGPLDALLMAMFMRDTGEKFRDATAVGSIEHFAAVMSYGPGRRRKMKVLG